MDSHQRKVLSTIFCSDVETEEFDGMPYPRCGKDTMKPTNHSIALSRHADIWICDLCGSNEAMLDYMRNPLPIGDWACMRISHGDDFRPATVTEHIDVIENEHIPFRRRCIGDGWRSTSTPIFESTVMRRRRTARG